MLEGERRTSPVKKGWEEGGDGGGDESRVRWRGGYTVLCVWVGACPFNINCPPLPTTEPVTPPLHPPPPPPPPAPPPPPHAPTPPR